VTRVALGQFSVPTYLDFPLSVEFYETIASYIALIYHQRRICLASESVVFVPHEYGRFCSKIGDTEKKMLTIIGLM
jgi:hypothetical protein